METHNTHTSDLRVVELALDTRAPRRLPAVVPVPSAAPPVSTLTDEQADGVLDELWHRRRRVRSLRFQGKTQAEIAKELGVNQATVSRDVAWLRARRREQFSAQGPFDPDAELAEAMELFDEVEREALKGFAKAGDNGKDANAFLRTAVFTRMARLNVLQDQGVLKRNLGTVGHVHVRASDLRAQLEKGGLLLPSGSKRTMLADDTDDRLQEMIAQQG